MGVSSAAHVHRRSMRARLAALVASSLACLTFVAPAAGQQVQPGPAVTVDAPGAGLLSVGGLSIARDGTGGVVYLKQADGVAHVFVSRLLGGVFQPPEQVDASLGGASSQPVVAAGNGGVLLVAFINAGTMYAVDRLGSGRAPQPPVSLYSGAQNPSIQ